MASGRNSRRWRQFVQGMNAEKRVFRILRELGDDFAVFNNVQARYGDIDHVVIRRDGTVFLVETKSHHGRVSYDGKQLLLNGHPFEKDFIAQINRNIPWLREEIRRIAGVNVWIVAILVFPDALMYSGRGRRVIRLGAINRVNTITGCYLGRLLSTYHCRTRAAKLWKNLDAFQDAPES